MTETDREFIVNLWKNRNSVNKIIQMLPYDKGTAKEIVDEVIKSGELNGIERISPKMKRIYELHQNGTTVSELSEMFNVTTNYVCRCLRKYGVYTGRPNKNHKSKKLIDKTESIINDLKDTESHNSFSDIARKHNVSRQYVFILYNKYVKCSNE